MNSSCEDAAEKSTFWRHGLRGETCCFSLDFRHLLQVERKKILCYATTIAALHRSLNRRRPLPYNWTSTQNERTGNIPLTVKMWAFFSLTRTRSLIFSMETKNWKVSSSPSPHTHLFRQVRSGWMEANFHFSAAEFHSFRLQCKTLDFIKRLIWLNLIEFGRHWTALCVCVGGVGRPPTPPISSLFPFEMSERPWKKRKEMAICENRTSLGVIRLRLQLSKRPTL